MIKPNTIQIGDALDLAKQLDDESVQCCVTSPPYYSMRDYGVAGQIGTEETPEEYIERLVLIFEEIRRALRGDGTLWVNIGDTYSHRPSKGSGRHSKTITRHKWKPKYPKRNSGNGTKSKDLMGMPWELALALRSSGWYLRADIIWHKRNCLPESVRDRPSKTHEYIFLLSRSERYYYDAEAIKEPAKDWGERDRTNWRARTCARSIGQPPQKGATSANFAESGRNARSVWKFSTVPYGDAHFAVFPPELPRRCIKAGSRPGDLILDPFCGSGTTLEVARRLGRRWIGFELNPEYETLINHRMAQGHLLDHAR